MKKQNQKQNKTVCIVSFLDIAKHPKNRGILKQIGLGERLEQLEDACANHLTVQKARYETLVNLELVRNRCTIRFKQVRKRLHLVRCMLRRYARDQTELQKVLGIHPSQTPSTTRAQELFGYWNQLLNGYHLLADGAFPQIELTDADLELCHALEVAVQFYDAECVSVMLHELDDHTGRQMVSQSRAEMEAIFEAIEAGMKNTILEGQAGWPLLEALFFPHRKAHVVSSALAEVLRHAC